MKAFGNKKAGSRKPFKHLKALLDDHCVPFSELPSERPPRSAHCQANESEEEFFLRAMSDVTPLPKPDQDGPCPPQRSPVSLDPDGEAESLSQLRMLVEYGQGFIVSETPEYMEGRGHQVSPEIPKKLHGGAYSIQAHIDLHGLNVPEAQQAFEAFLKEAITQGKRAVLVVHGRGLSSPNQPVLKNRLYHWLTAGPWRKWVIAFTSARSCDGGAGATYVLLRHRPLSKRHRKRAKVRVQPA